MHSHADDLGKLLLRVTIGGLMLFHGVQKVRDGIDPKMFAMVEGQGLPRVVAYGVYVGEVAAPAMIIVGLFTRLAALVLVINMIFAVALAHRDQLWTLTEHGTYALELQAFYLFGSLALLFMGGGRYALTGGGFGDADEPPPPAATPRPKDELLR